MNSKRLEEIITCGVCFELFNEDNRRPRMSSCGHTFCHSCFKTILEQTYLCPSCKVSIHQKKAELIPINFTIKGLISIFKQEFTIEATDNSLPMNETDSMPLKLESVGLCDAHSSNKDLRCMNCESWICAMCGVLQHKQCKILLAEDYKELTIQVYKKIEKELEARKSINDSISQSLELLEKEMKELKREKKKKKRFDLKICEKRIEKLLSLKSEDNKFCETLQQLGTVAEESYKANEFSFALSKLEDLIVRGKMLASHLKTLYAHWPWLVPNTIEELKKLCNDFPVYVVENEKDVLYGMVEVKNRQIWISSFHSQLPEGQFFAYSELLSRFRGSMEHPKAVFLKLAPGGDSNKEVDLVIETDGTSLRTKYFIFLCLGLKLQNYKGRVLKYKDSSFYELNPGPPPVVEGIIKEEDKYTTWEEGFIVGTLEGNSNFYIAMEGDDAEYSLTKIGVVVSGLQELKKLKGKKLLIKESGLVI